MIQELLGGGAVGHGFINGGERKISMNGNVLEAATTSPSSSTTPPNNNNATSDNQNLRCPRCDSSNTKFCYYNNYNLTQPRHFCKTCRRYWTKGGALRNVPIGGGCRKNKSSSSVSCTPVGKSSTSLSSAAKLKTTVAYEIGRSSSSLGLLDHELPSSPIMWASPQNSHLLALLRGASQQQNPNSVKEEGGAGGLNIGAQMMSEPVVGTSPLNGTRNMVLDPLLGHQVIPSLGLCSSLWKNSNQHQAQQQQYHQQQQNGYLVGHEVQNSGIQELYHRLKSTTTSNYYGERTQQPLVLNNGSSSSSSILESAPVNAHGAELGYNWNPASLWSDLSTTNGAYH